MCVTCFRISCSIVKIMELDSIVLVEDTLLEKSTYPDLLLLEHNGRQYEVAVVLSGGKYNILIRTNCT